VGLQISKLRPNIEKESKNPNSLRGYSALSIGCGAPFTKYFLVPCMALMAGNRALMTTNRTSTMRYRDLWKLGSLDRLWGSFFQTRALMVGDLAFMAKNRGCAMVYRDLWILGSLDRLWGFFLKIGLLWQEIRL